MLIIFDFDGVLRSASWEGLFKAYVALVEYKGKDYKELFGDLEEFKAWFNSDWRENLRRIGEFERREYPVTDKIFHSLYDPHIRIFPWVKTLLEDLSKRHTLALLSASSVKSIEKSLDNLSDFFSVIAGSEHVNEIKPDPEGIHLILEKLNGILENTLIIGDTEADILAGQAAGIKTGAVKWGGLTPWETLMDLKPDYAFHEPEELFSL